jgi:hypothetical protein
VETPAKKFLSASGIPNFSKVSLIAVGTSSQFVSALSLALMKYVNSSKLMNDKSGPHFGFFSYKNF